jgi:lysophospholipase L1-like esterase
MTATVTTLPTGFPAPRAATVRTLVTLGDSTVVGLGDPVPGGGWRGFPLLLGAALGATVVNPSRAGARMSCVRREQLPVALPAVHGDVPAVAVLFAGMNDTLRSDFDPRGIRDDCAAIVAELRAAGAHVLIIRYHDHTRVFRLPGPLRRALVRRIGALNAAMDAVAAAHPVGVLDLHTLPGGYDRTAWAVDRLHPSELGHRMLAAALAQLLVDAGYAVPQPVSLRCAGGRPVTSAQRVAWLVAKGVPWLVRRAGDLGPVILQGLVDGMRRPAA